ncbi:hypothetical protein QNI16_00845 [Cytophagaceae bacterium YF14B1]|uniref:Uncharacterized protein n=1 Tax=Xanthocytophaga flava TaxID=3048013 RepID=A0AAE3QLB2_9BACT|nr:hypothetical protein [Xanthocytophaga flavus]MDJ1479006.1 hypothetical protein [Xanthocytophaga flavus]
MDFISNTLYAGLQTGNFVESGISDSNFKPYAKVISSKPSQIETLPDYQLETYSEHEEKKYIWRNKQEIQGIPLNRQILESTKFKILNENYVNSQREECQGFGIISEVWDKLSTSQNSLVTILKIEFTLDGTHYPPRYVSLKEPVSVMTNNRYKDLFGGWDAQTFMNNTFDVGEIHVLQNLYFHLTKEELYTVRLEEENFHLQIM